MSLPLLGLPEDSTRSLFLQMMVPSPDTVDLKANHQRETARETKATRVKERRDQLQKQQPRKLKPVQQQQNEILPDRLKLFVSVAAERGTSAVGVPTSRQQRNEDPRMHL